MAWCGSNRELRTITPLQPRGQLARNGVPAFTIQALQKVAIAADRSSRGNKSYLAHRRCPRTLHYLWHTFPSVRHGGAGWWVETAPPADNRSSDAKEHTSWFLRAAPPWFRSQVMGSSTFNRSAWRIFRQHASTCVNWH